MRIAYVMAQGEGETDRLILGLAERLMAQGLRLCGTVQVNSARADGQPCDMDVVVLPDGPVIRISQSRGREARGCRLDPQGLETAVGMVTARFEQGADGLIINKFGKHEAEGRGFRHLIGEALGRGVPVLVGLNALNRAAFLDFTEGLAVELPSREQDQLDWFGAPSVASARPGRSRGLRPLGEAGPGTW